MLKKIKWSTVKSLLKGTFSGYFKDECIRLSAALSYYTIFSLPPLLIVIISLCGIFFGQEAVRGEIFGQINGLIGNSAAMQIQEILKNIELKHSNGLAATIGVITLLLGASGVFGEIQGSINYIWGLKAKPNRGFVKFLKNRLMSFSMIGAMGFLLLVGLIINSAMDVFGNQLAAYFPNIAVSVFYVLNIILVYAIITVLFVVIFKTLPDGKVAFRDAIIGASITSVLFMIGKFAIGVYLSQSSISTTYGAAGSLILILLWVYYSANILYLGAEFTKVYSTQLGKKIIAKDYAVKIDKEKIEIELKLADKT